MELKLIKFWLLPSPSCSSWKPQCMQLHSSSPRCWQYSCGRLSPHLTGPHDASSVPSCGFSWHYAAQCGGYASRYSRWPFWLSYWFSLPAWQHTSRGFRSFTCSTRLSGLTTAGTDVIRLRAIFLVEKTHFSIKNGLSHFQI